MIRSAAICTLALASAAALAGQPASVRSAHFDVWSEAGAESAVSAAAHLENTLAGLGALGWPTPAGRVQVVIVGQGGVSLPHDAARQATASRTRGVSIDGDGLRVIVVAWEAPGDVFVALGHELVHQLQGPNTAQSPLCVREGQAEVLGRLRRADGAGVVGAAAAEHVRRLSASPWIPWPELAAATPASPAYARDVFYAQSWLLSHWLMSEAGGEQDLGAVLQRRLAEYGQAELDRRLRAHLAALPVIETYTYREQAARYTAQPLGEWAIPTLLAEVRMRVGSHYDTEREFQDLAQRFPGRPEPLVGLARLAMRRNDYDGAEARFAEAARLGMADALAWYQLGLLRMRPEAVAGSVPATTAMRRARELDPGEPLYDLGLAQAAGNAGDYATGEVLLLRLQQNPEWSERAGEELVQLELRQAARMARLPSPLLPLQVPPAPALLPDWNPGRVARPGPQPRPRRSWPPPGTLLLAGNIVLIECQGEGKLLTLSTAREKLVLFAPAGRPVALYNAPAAARELPCGVVLWDVNLAYRPDRSRPGVRGRVVGIVF